MLNLYQLRGKDRPPSTFASVAASAADCPATHADSSGFQGGSKIVLTRGGNICGAIWGQ
jgi:hypothetical protein